MPTYEYVCDGCGHDFELFQQMTAPVKRKCPECGRLKLRRLVGTGSGVIFRGSGFYETDYRSDSYRKGQEAEKKSNGAGKDDKKKKPAKEDSSAGGKADAAKDSSTKKPNRPHGGKRQT